MKTEQQKVDPNTSLRKLLADGCGYEDIAVIKGLTSEYAKQACRQIVSRTCAEMPV